MNTYARYAYCGKWTKSVLARHYTDFSPQEMKEIYEKSDSKAIGTSARG
jgi:hypothetical protein